MKNSFVAWVTTKGHVVVITLCIHLTASGAAIAEPSAIKEPATPPGNERSKTLDSGLQCDKLGAEKGIDVFRPRGLLGINGTKLGEDRGTESGTSSDTTSMTLAGPRNKLSDKHTDDANECDGYCGLYISLPFWLIALCLSLFGLRDPWGGMPNPFLKHNA